MSQSTEKFELDVIVLAGKLGSLTQGVHHAITLGALLALYVGIARNNGCCAQAALSALEVAAEEIADEISGGLPGVNLQIHQLLVH